jgi:DNA-binding SARP family transcriptional activator
MSASTELSVRIYLLGRFEIVRGEQRLRAADWTRRKAATLFQRLTLDSRLVKERAIDFLWPEADQSSGANNLYRTLYALRQTLDNTLGPHAAGDIFTFSDGVLALDETVWVDVHEFESLYRAHEHSIPNLQRILDLYRGDLLPDDLYSDWLTSRRESLRRLYREASINLADRFRENLELSSVISLLTPLLISDPADEPVHRELMRTYALAGRRHDALRQYQTCSEALATELDLPPEPETTLLYEQILGGEITLAPVSKPESIDIQTPRLFTPAGPFGNRTAPLAPLVGRDAELKNLNGLVDKARSGQGLTILLAGESGLGKTRLASEALRVADEVGMITLFGAAYEQEGQLAYQPFIEAIDNFLSGIEPVIGAGDGQREQLHNPITWFKRIGSGDGQQQSWALFNDVASFLNGLGAQSLANDGAHVPAVLFVDDLHAADEGTLHLFHFLARQTRATPFVLMASYRTDVQSVTTPFGTLLSALYRERLSETVTLTPLGEPAIRHMLDTILKGEPSPSLVSTLGAITEGNPFFIEEIGRSLLGDDVLRKRDGRWHLSKSASGDRVPVKISRELNELLQSRVARLGGAVVSTLTTAAVIGRDFEYEVLRQATRGLADSDDIGDRSLLDALDDSMAAGLLDETGNGYRFHHPLIRRNLYDSLSKVRRALLHSQVAESIQSVSARRNRKPDAYVEELAFHYDRSDRRDRALDYLIRAGRNAARTYAYEVAVDYYERALGLIDALGLVNARRRFRLLERVGSYHKILADTPKTLSAVGRALETEGADWKPTARDVARLRRMAALALLTAGHIDEAADHLQKALEALEDSGNEGAELANLLYNIAQIHWHRNEYQESFDVAQRSLSIAERADDQGAIARAFEMLALACHSLGEWQRGLGFEEQRATLAGSGLEVTDAFDIHL